LALTILVFPRRASERETIVKALARDLPDARVETPAASAMPQRLTQSPCDAVLCALQPAVGASAQLLHDVKQHHPNCPVIWYAAKGEEDLDVLALSEAMRNGLDDYIGHLDRPSIPPARAIRQALDLSSQARDTASQALLESEKRYRLLFESNPQPMWVVDLENYDFLAVNDAAIRHYGYSREEFLAMKTTDIRSEEDVPRLLDQMRAIRGDPGGMGDAGIWTHVKKDGSLVESQISWHNLSFLGRPAELVLVNDVTERRRLEDQLRQAGRIEAIGRLAGGVAHDFNNLLSLIIGYSELLLEGLSPVDPRRKSAEEIRAAGQRAASLTRQLLAFSRKQVLQPEVLDLNEVAERTGKMLRRLIGEDIELVFKLDPVLHAVLADRGQIEQVLLNLAVNARDAMPDGGTVTVESANVQLDAAYAWQHNPIQAGHYVMLAFSDTGHGMDAKTKSHIFEPFFTTKETGKGTGLGLATVYGIVKQSEGFIWVYSEPGQGATFKIYLPPTGVAIPVMAAEETLAPESVHGRETILVVEDEAPLRELAADFLRGCGYHVLEAGNGADALDLVLNLSGHLDLLVTDVVMPGMSGRALAERLAERAADTKVLYLSGYTDEAIHRHGVLEPGVALLQKPFRLADLARRVREILDNN
jgi:two-component system cell cycle sensor histidine kinase/response regulator CckA